MKVCTPLSALFLMLSFAHQAQDLIVTKRGDSIKCHVIRATDKFKHARHYEDTGGYVRKAVPNDDIQFYQKGFFDPAPEEWYTERKNSLPTRVRVDIAGGFSYLTAPPADDLPTELKTYERELRSGYHMNLGVIHYLTPILGFGLRYSFFRTSNQANVPLHIPGAGTINATVRDDIRQNYLGPYFEFRTGRSTPRFEMRSGFSVGYMNYQNYSTYLGNFILSAEAVAVNVQTGVNWSAGRNISIGFFAAYTWSYFNSMEVDDGLRTQTIDFEDGEAANLSRVELGLSIGLRH